MYHPPGNVESDGARTYEVLGVKRTLGIKRPTHARTAGRKIRFGGGTQTRARAKTNRAGNDG